MPHCIKAKTADLRASLCVWCEGTRAAVDATAELEAAGYSVTRGVCSRCIRRYGADSLKGTVLELADA